MEKIIGSLLGAIVDNSPKGVLTELCVISIDKCGDIVKFNNAIDDFLQYVENEEIRIQMDCLIKSIKSAISRGINSNNLFIFDELSELLDTEMEQCKIPIEQRENLKNNLIACLLTYISKKDIGFFNDLTSKRNIEKSLRSVNQRLDGLKMENDKLSGMVLKMRENIIEQNNKKSPIRMPVSSLPLNRSADMIERANEKRDIQYSFDTGSNIVFLNGRPGMGKTTLAKMYANGCNYKEIYFEEYKRNMDYTIAELGKDNRTLADKDRASGDEILAYWESLDSERRKSILLIIDNFNGDTLQNGNEQHFVAEMNSNFIKRLKNIGIHVLITTRINILSESSIEVGAVQDTIQLFEKYYGGNLTEEEKMLIKELVKTVQGNTMLIVQSAYIWRKSDTSRKRKLVDQLKNCRLKENDILLEDKTLYEQVKAMLNFSGIRTDSEINKTFACATLMPLKGEYRDKFIEMSRCNINKLNELVDGSWILMDTNENISLHPVVKEMAIREGLVAYEYCEQVCNFINNALNLDLPLEDRYPYADCAWEIYKIFTLTGNLNDVLIRIFYRLSDIYDRLGEHKRSMELAETIHENLQEINFDSVEKVRMLSGIAYSINNSFENIEELNKAAVLLETAQKNMRAVPEERMDNLDVRQVKVRILSNMGSNNLAKRKYNQAEAKKYLEEALYRHKKALSSRLRYLEEADDTEIEKIWKREVATSYTTVATDYFYMEEYEKAIRNHLAACEIRQELTAEYAMCINQQRIIGCLLEWYKKKFTINEQYWEMILNYYPTLLERNYKFNKVDEIDKNVRYFKEIFEIIQYDRRLEGYITKMRMKKQEIVEWIGRIDELEERFGNLENDDKR